MLVKNCIGYVLLGKGDDCWENWDLIDMGIYPTSEDAEKGLEEVKILPEKFGLGLVEVKDWQTRVWGNQVPFFMKDFFTVDIKKNRIGSIAILEEVPSDYVSTTDLLESIECAKKQVNKESLEPGDVFLIGDVHVIRTGGCINTVVWDD